MKLLLLCNIAPAVVQEKISGKAAEGLWLDHMLDSLRRENMEIFVLCRGNGAKGQVDAGCSYATFQEKQPDHYLPELEACFCQMLDDFQPDVIHVWGTEYGHTLAMIHAAEKRNMLDHLVVNIQGLTSIIARHHNEGIPCKDIYRSSFRDFLRRNNLYEQQRVFARRGELEIQALRKVRHVVGRTHWDLACIKQINPDIIYHHCNETLRAPFYDGQWHYDACRKHSIFAPGSNYPVKGFHYLIEAFAEVLKTYPDATLSLPGKGFPAKGDLKARLRSTHYQNYLASLVRKYNLEDKIRFLGSLNAEQMKQAYLDANVFVLPSTIENSPNTLGEAMLLGAPCVASHVGGVTTLLKAGDEGFVYPSTAPYMLAWHIGEIFAMEDAAEKMGEAARQHALELYDPRKNHRELLDIYEKIRK